MAAAAVSVFTASQTTSQAAYNVNMGVNKEMWTGGVKGANVQKFDDEWPQAAAGCIQCIFVTSLSSQLLLLLATSSLIAVSQRDCFPNLTLPLKPSSLLNGANGIKTGTNSKKS